MDSKSKKRRYNSNFPNGYDPEIGSIHHGMKSNQKKFIEWEFTTSNADQKMTVVHMTVFVMRPTMERAHEPAKPLRFSVKHPHSTEVFEDTDINRLKETVEKDLIDKVNLITGIEWEDWLEVRVTGSNSEFDDSVYSGMGAEMKVSISRLKKGHHPDTGKPLTINKNRVVVPFPKSRSIDIEQQEQSIYRHEGEISYIPDTKQNRDALREIQDRLTELKIMLAKFLSQEFIETSLIHGKLIADIKAKTKKEIEG